MAEIKCPHCGKSINIDKSDYESLLNDVEKEEINSQVEAQVKQVEEKIRAEYALIEEKNKNKQSEELANLNKENEVLKEKLKTLDKENEIKVKEALEKANKELLEKEQQLRELKAKAESDLQLESNKITSSKDKEISELNAKIAVLEKEIENNNTETKLKVKEASDELKEELNKKEQEIQSLKEQHSFAIQAKDEEIKHWKEFRVGDSTKDIGESLEQYCHDVFDEIRAIAYPNAYFEKDNEVIGGTKGDFIFRDYLDDDPENEIVSIMFEMKNQKEDGDTKNESHLKKLDGDRYKKKCEYAVLVSTLEPDSKLYNSGIVDVSHKYPKMFVVRPQFFLTIIGLIKNMGKTRFEYKRQVIQYQRENVDITNFENAVRQVAQKIGEDYENAGKQYDKVEKMCDDMIKKLTDLKEVFRLGKRWIGTAQNRLPELEIRKLTKNNPTMKEKFDELDKKDK